MKTSTPCFPNPREGKQGSAGRAGVMKRWREAAQTYKRFLPARGLHPKGGLSGTTGRASIRLGVQEGWWGRFLPPTPGGRVADVEVAG